MARVEQRLEALVEMDYSGLTALYMLVGAGVVLTLALLEVDLLGVMVVEAKVEIILRLPKLQLVELLTLAVVVEVMALALGMVAQADQE